MFTMELHVPTIYKLIQDDDFTKEYESNVDDLVDIKKSSLHKVASRPTILPYYDMVRWVISHTNFTTCRVVNSSCQIVGSFRRDDITHMYKLDMPTLSPDDNFIKKFIQKEVDGEEIRMDDLIRNW
jgi:hypothetical protein